MPFNSPIRFTPKKASPFRVFGLPDAEIEAAREAAKLNKAKETRSVASTIGDMASAGGQAAIGTVQAITDFASPTSAPSNFLRDLPQYWQGIESPQYKARQEANAREMEAIPEGDWLGRGLQTAENVVEDPFGSAAKLTGSMLPFIAAAPLGLPAMTGMGAAVGGGTVRGGIFENVLSSPEQNLLKDPRYVEMRSRMPEQDAKVAFGDLMASFGESGAEIGTGALIGGITGSLGAEASAVKALTRGATRNALTKQAAQLAPTAILKGALSEAGQETFEEGSQQYLANVAAASGGAEIDPWKNVVEGAVEGGLLGLGGGGFGKAAEGLAGRSRLNALNIEEGFVAPPSAKPKLTVQNAEIKSQQALENPALDEDDESGEMDAAAIASLALPNPNADLAQVFGYVPPQPEVDQVNVAQPESVAVPETGTEIQDLNVPSNFVAQVAPVGPEVGQDQVQPLVAPSEKEIAKAEKEKFKLQEKILKAQQAVDAKLAKEEAKPLVVREQSLQRLSDTIPPESGIQALPIAEGDSAVNRPVEPGGAIEASPALAQSPVDVPNASPAPGQVVENGASQPISVDAAHAPAPSVATGIAQEIQDAPKVSQAPQQVNPPVAEEQDLESLLQQSVQNPAQKAVPKAVAPKSTPVPSQTVYAGDKVQVGDQIGEAVGNQKNGMVTVRYPDGTTKIQRASEVRKLAPEPQSKGDRQELVGKLRDAIPANHPKKAEIDAAIQAFQENDTAENEGAVSKALKDAGLWKSANPFDTAVDAIAKGQDPVEAVIRQGRSRPEAEKAAKKAESFVNKKKANGTWDPNFERGDKPIPGIHRRMTIADMWEGIVENFRTTVPKALTQLQLKAEQMLEGPMTEAIWKSYNGIKDSARAVLYRDAYRVNIGKSKFVIADFEGDVPSSVVSDLARITEDLAGRMQSVSRRVSTAAGTPVDAFAGFAPSGNLAGVTLGQKVYINPLKHVKGVFSGSRRIARRMLNTLVHELAHANGFSKHDKAFEAEQGRIWDALKKANLIEGMEVEIAKGLDNELISKLNGIYDTAQKGWYNARYKARKLSRSEGRQSDRAVPRVSTEGDRASGVSPPNGNRESVSGARKSERGSSEELGTASEDGRVDEAEAGGADSGRGVLGPKFARAWHGTPHKFDKFQFDDKVRGTGEGAQAYGDGLYFAQDEAVGRQYSSAGKLHTVGVRLADGRVVSSRGRTRSDSGIEDYAVDALVRFDGDKAAALDWLDDFGSDLDAKKWIKKNINTSKADLESVANLYHVDIPDSVVDRMLDWDKPLSEQAESVQQALRDAYVERGMPLDSNGEPSFLSRNLTGLGTIDGKKPKTKGEFVAAEIMADEFGDIDNAVASIDRQLNKSNDPTLRDAKKILDGIKSGSIQFASSYGPRGESIYNSLVGAKDAKAASKLLLKHGIPGIKYLDGNSRSKGEGSRNFVVFDAKDVTILTRNGEKVTGQEKTDAIDEMQEQHPETAEKPEEPSFSREAESSENFKKWFADSKVIDADGKPLAVYHRGEFDETENGVPIVGKEGMHFGTKTAADMRPSGKRVDDIIKGLEITQDDDGRWHWDSYDGTGSYDLDESGFSTKEEAREDGERYAVSQGENDWGDDEDGSVLTEVFLSIKNPMRTADQGGDWTAAVKKAKSLGHDGIVYRNLFEDKGSTSYIAFRPEQIKSVNNRGTFDPTNPDISFSREAEEDVEEKPTEITLPQDTWSQKRVYEYVDSKAKIQTMMEAVEATTGKRADVDLHEASIAVSSITAHEIKQLNDFHVNPLSEFMKANKISTKEAGRYIWAKENIDGAIDSEKADESRAIVEEIESGDKADAFSEIDTAVKRIIQVGRGAAIDSGLSTKDNVSIDGAEEGVVQRIIEKAARTIVKANENRFRTQLGTFLAKNPSSEWAINPKKAVGGKTIPYYVNGKKQRIWIKDKVLGEQIESLSDGENSWFMDGVRRMTRGFAVVNTRANPVFPVKNFIRDLMFGLGKIYVDDGPKIMGETWRGLKNAIPTMWKYHKNPNYWKDLPKGSDAYKWGAAAELLYRSGGIPQWFGLPSQDAIKELLDTDIKGFDGSKLDAAYKPFKRFWNGMKMLSEVSEGATRLAYLKTLVDPSESGKQMPIQDAIKKARGITGDFQRHGNKKNMRYAYAFFNSSIQGATAMANLTKELKDGNPRARNLAMFLVGLGMSQALAGMLAGDADGDDQNDYEQIPEYTKNSNLIIPIPGYPVAIPLPYGLNVPIVAGMGIIRTALSDEPDAASKSAINVMHSAMKSFNPMGDEASLMQFISPTVLDPIAQASENLDSLGRKINRDRYYGEEKLPESQITSRKDSAPAKAIASAMNRLGGGDEITPAKISFMDVHPGTIDNTMAWLMGAAGRFVKDSGLAAASAAKGEVPQKIPLWNDFVKTPKNSFYTGRFWEQIEEIRSFKDSARQLDENARREQALELGLDTDTVESMTRADLKKRIQLSRSRSDAISKRIEQTAGQRVKLLPMYEDLRKQISALQKSNDPNSDDRIIELVKAANRKYVEATR